MDEIEALRQELAETNARLDDVIDMLGALYRMKLAEIDRKAPLAGAAEAMLDLEAALGRLTRRRS
jgi:hypothetical protein